MSSVCETAKQAFPPDVKIVCEAATGEMSNDAAMPLALILNELLTNAVKHGLKDGKGTIRAGLADQDGSFILYVEDEGSGFDLESVLPRSLGLATLQQPVLAMMDVCLTGDRDGIDAALEMFQNMGIRCIFATAHDDAATLNRAEAAHPLGWLPKPYTPMALIEMVRLALRDLDDQQS